jgi:hypothetical protein
MLKLRSWAGVSSNFTKYDLGPDPRCPRGYYFLTNLRRVPFERLLPLYSNFCDARCNDVDGSLIKKYFIAIFTMNFMK